MLYLFSLESPDVTERVYVFAQTLYIDQSVTFPWSIYIRARQIIINYEASPSLTFPNTSPEFPVDIATAVSYGLPSDMVFQKLSLLCAQMLISSLDEDQTQSGWNIIDDMAQDRAYSEEQQNFLDHVRGVRAGLTSLGRSNINWAPYFTQLYYTNSLGSYYSDITLYYNIFLELIEDAIDCSSFVDRASTLVNIWSAAILANADIEKVVASDMLAASEEMYQG